MVGSVTGLSTFLLRLVLAVPCPALLVCEAWFARVVPEVAVTGAVSGPVIVLLTVLKVTLLSLLVLNPVVVLVGWLAELAAASPEVTV